MAKNGHIRLRRGVLEHIKSGKMRQAPFGLYAYLLLEADWKTGIVWHTSAPIISGMFREQAKQINRQLLKLEKQGYIKRFGHRGQINAYEILIGRYQIFNGVLIDAANSTDINNIAWTPGVKGELIGKFRELQVDGGIVYVSSYDELKDIKIEKRKVEEKPKKTVKKAVKEKKIVINKKNNDAFDVFWKKYHKITGMNETDRVKATNYWNFLTSPKQEKAVENIDLYYQSLKNKNFCNKAVNYLRGENFEDEFSTKEDGWNEKKASFING